MGPAESVVVAVMKAVKGTWARAVVPVGEAAAMMAAVRAEAAILGGAILAAMLAAARAAAWAVAWAAVTVVVG